MKKILQFVPVQLTCFIIIGILIGKEIFFSTFLLIGISCLLLSLLFIFNRLERKQLVPNFRFTIVVYLLSIWIGVTAVNVHNDDHYNNHYSKHIKSKNDLVLTVRKVLRPTANSKRYIAEITQINSEFVFGKILFVHANQLDTLFQVDQKIYIDKAVLKQIQEPLNPYSFNYAAYLKNKQITHSVYLKEKNQYMFLAKKTTLQGWSSGLRIQINNSLKNCGITGEELAIINALLLGQQQDLLPELRQKYINAGAMHILAVSGLHIGVLLYVLNLLFCPLLFFKKGKLVRLILVVVLLWFYAIIAGMSASVIRAVTMFTVLAIGSQMNRKTNIYNILFVSMFWLLICYPNYLFDVGFQLSYLAVFSIVWIQPILYAKWQPKYKVINFFWKLFTVSIAAQLGLLPLSLYYFHQFPLLFFVVNLTIVPLLGIILSLGIIIIVISLLGVEFTLLIDGYRILIQLMNWIVRHVANQERLLLSEIPFSFLLMFVSFIIVTCSVRFFEKFNYKRFRSLLIALLCLQVALFYEYIKHENIERFTVFNVNKASLFAYQKGRAISFKSISDSLSVNALAILKNHKQSIVGLEYKVDKGHEIYQFKNNRILIIDSLVVIPEDIQVDIMVLTNSPKVNLERVFQQVSPKYIIADASNYKYLISYWEKTCKKDYIKFHYTKVDGAFVLE